MPRRAWSSERAPASGSAAALSARAGAAGGRTDPAPPPARRPIPAGPAPGRREPSEQLRARRGHEQLGPPPGPHGGLRRAPFSLKQAPSPNLRPAGPPAAPTAHRSSIASGYYFFIKTKISIPL